MIFLLLLYDLIVFEHKGYIGEINGSFTKLPLICDVPCCVAREAGPVGRSSRAGGARVGGKTGQSSGRAALFNGQGSWTSRTETSTYVLGSKMISTLVTI